MKTRHPFSKLFPDMDKQSFNRLVNDLKAVGLIHPIMLLDGQVLDGWHRYTACLKAGVEPRFVEFEGDEADAMMFVMSENAVRRHLNEAARISVSKKASEWHFKRAMQGDNRFSRQVPGTHLPKTVSEVAKLADVSESTVKRHTTIEREAPHLMPMIEKGEVSLRTAVAAIRNVEGELLKAPTADDLKRYASLSQNGVASKVREMVRAAQTLKKLHGELKDLVDSNDEVASGISEVLLILQTAMIRRAK